MVQLVTGSISSDAKTFIRPGIYGACICGQPRTLASTLARLQSGVEHRPMEANPSTAHMFIVNPFAGGVSGLRSLFSIRPPTEERIRRLEEMA